MQLSVAFITSRISIICSTCWPYNIEKIVNVYPPPILEPLQSNTGQYVFLAGAYEILSKIPE